MEKISDHDLDVILDVETASAEHEENWLVVKALQELKERRKKDSLYKQGYIEEWDNPFLTEPLSDKMISDEIESLKCWENGLTPVRQTLLRALVEIKQHREADSKQLDIKDQLRLVRDKCPDVWCEFHKGQYSSGYCYREFMGGDNSCLSKTCKECWDKALEGDE